MAVEIGWQHGPEGIDGVWLMDHSQWVCQLFEYATDTDGDRRPALRP